MNAELYSCKNVYLCEVSDRSKDENIVLRIELFRHCKQKNKFLFSVMRLDSYRIKPTFPLDNKKISFADERIFVEDVFIWPNNKTVIAYSEKAAIKILIRNIEKKLNIRIH